MAEEITEAEFVAFVTKLHEWGEKLPEPERVLLAALLQGSRRATTESVPVAARAAVGEDPRLLAAQKLISAGLASALGRLRFGVGKDAFIQQGPIWANFIQRKIESSIDPVINPVINPATKKRQ